MLNQFNIINIYIIRDRSDDNSDYAPRHNQPRLQRGSSHSNEDGLSRIAASALSKIRVMAVSLKFLAMK